MNRWKNKELRAFESTALGAAIELLGRTGIPAYEAGKYMREVQRENLTTARIVFWFDDNPVAKYTIFVLLFRIRSKEEDGWDSWVASMAVLHAGEDKFVLEFDEAGKPTTTQVIGGYPFWHPANRH